MSNVFLNGLTNEHRDRLIAANVPCYDLTLGQDFGLMVEEKHLAAALAALGVYIESQTDSGYEGIANAILKPKLPVPFRNHKVMNDWKGGEHDDFTVAARQFLMPAADREVILHNRGGHICEPLSDGKFHIHLYSSALTWQAPGAIPPHTIWGYTIKYKDAGYLPSGRGVPIVDEASGYALAELVGDDNLYVHLNLHNEYTPNRGRIFRVLMQKLAHLVGMPADEYRKLMRDRFVEECSKTIVRVVSDTARDADHEGSADPALVGNILPALKSNSRFAATGGKIAAEVNPSTSANTQSTAELRQQIQERKARIQALRKQLAHEISAARSKERRMLTDESVNLEEFGLEYENLMKVKYVKDVKVEKDAIVILTEVLNCRDERTGIYHEMGAFKISLPMNGTSPRWQNLTRQVNGMRTGQHAPHVWADGSACLGNTQDIFPRLFAQRQWSIAAQLAIEFVQAANTSDAAGKYVNSWPRATNAGR